MGNLVVASQTQEHGLAGFYFLKEFGFGPLRFSGGTSLINWGHVTFDKTEGRIFCYSSSSSTVGFGEYRRRIYKPGYEGDVDGQSLGYSLLGFTHRLHRKGNQLYVLVGNATAGSGPNNQYAYLNLYLVDEETLSVTRIQPSYSRHYTYSIGVHTPTDNIFTGGQNAIGSTSVQRISLIPADYENGWSSSVFIYPSVLPTHDNVRGIHVRDNSVIFGCYTSPTFYAWQTDGESFGTKLVNPSSPDPSVTVWISGNDVHNVITVSAAGDGVHSYTYTDVVGFTSKKSNPVAIDALGYVYRSEYSKDGSLFFITTTTAGADPAIHAFMVDENGDISTKYSDPIGVPFSGALGISYDELEFPFRPNSLVEGNETIGNKARIHWSLPVHGIPAKYEIERSPDDSTWEKVGEREVLSFWDQGLEPESLYYFRVRSVNSDGLVSEYSDSIQVVTPPGPIDPVEPDPDEPGPGPGPGPEPDPDPSEDPSYTEDISQSFASLKGEPLPLIPEDLDPRTEKYLRDLHGYLNRSRSRDTQQAVTVVDKSGAVQDVIDENRTRIAELEDQMTRRPTFKQVTAKTSLRV